MRQFFTHLADCASAVCYVAALIGCVYALFAIWTVRGFARSTYAAAPVNFPPVTILKPLHGAEPDLYAHLASFCRQDYPLRSKSCSASPMPAIRPSQSSAISSPIVPIAILPW